MTPFRRLLVLVLCGAGLAGWPGGALAQTNQAHRQQLLQSVPGNYAVARSNRAARNEYVPTNTPAFQEWALSLMLTQANFLNEQWKLGLPKPITSDHVTRLSVLAKIEGPEGGITINNRFTVGFNNGRWLSFQDGESSWENIETAIPLLERLSKQSGSLTKARAAQIAREALHQVGIDEKRLKVSLPPEVTQYEYESKQGQVLPLPLYKVEWRLAKEFVPVRMEISGLTGKVVSYVNYLAPAMTCPTNYFALLGVSSRPNEWGAQYGYESLNTPEFQSAARKLATDQMNRLNEVWSLGSQPLSTNDLRVFQAKPDTNSFDIPLARFGDRFYLQIAQSRIQLFQDSVHNMEGLTATEEKIKQVLTLTNLLDAKAAVQVARGALHRMGFDEKQLQLREPPTVKQVRIDSEQGRPLILPLYDVFWLFPADMQQQYGEGAAAVGFQISGLTKKVVMYANNWLLTPKLPFPTNTLVKAQIDK